MSAAAAPASPEAGGRCLLGWKHTQVFEEIHLKT